MTKSSVTSRIRRLCRFAVRTAALAILAALPAAQSFAASGRLNFQGRLIDATSKNPKSGTFNITFRICDSETGSCATPLWSESQSLPVVNGLFAAQLGAVTPLNASLFASGAERFLEIQVGSETLSVRERLANSPYAFRASLADDVAPDLNHYIRNSSNLQAGSGFHVSSAAVAGKLDAGSAVILTQLRLGNFAALPASNALGAGALVFNTSDNNVYVSNGPSWAPLASGGASPWSAAAGVVSLVDPSNRIQASTAAFDSSLTLAGLSVLNNVSAGSGILISGSGSSRTIAADGPSITGISPGNLAAGALPSGVVASSIAANSVRDGSIVSVSAAKLTGQLPALDGSLLTGVSASVVSDAAQFSGAGTSTAPLTLRSSSVTLQGNTFNGPNQLLKLDGTGKLPALDASALTSVPGGYRTVTLLSDGLGLAITAALIGSEPPGLISRRTVDLSGATQVRAQFSSSLALAAVKCRVDFSIDDGATWQAAPLVADFSAGSSPDMNSRSSWSAVPQAANADVLVRAVILGDGLLSPVIRYIQLDYK